MLNLSFLDQQKKDEKIALTASDVRGLDFDVVEADGFHAAVKASRDSSRTWNELEAIALERCKTGNSWKLSDLSRLHAFFGKTSATSNTIRTFIQDVILRSVGDTKPTSWEKLIKIAKSIDSEQEFIDTCKFAEIDGSDIASRSLRGMLKTLIRDQKGMVITSRFDGDLEDAVDFGNPADNIIGSMSDSMVKVQRVSSAVGELDAVWESTRNQIYERMMEASGECGTCRKLAKAYFDGEISDVDFPKKARQNRVAEEKIKTLAGILKSAYVRRIKATENAEFAKVKKDVMYGEEILVTAGSVGEVVERSDKDWTVKFDSLGVIVTADKGDFDVVSKAAKKIDIIAVIIENMAGDAKQKVAKKICPLCEGELFAGRRSQKCIQCDTTYVRNRIAEDEGNDDAIGEDAKDVIMMAKELVQSGSETSVLEAAKGLIDDDDLGWGKEKLLRAVQQILKEKGAGKKQALNSGDKVWVKNIGGGGAPVQDVKKLGNVNEKKAGIREQAKEIIQMAKETVIENTGEERHDDIEEEAMAILDDMEMSEKKRDALWGACLKELKNEGELEKGASKKKAGLIPDVDINLIDKAKGQDKVDRTITVGKAVRIVGNNASPYYGKVGLIERMTPDGWVGINLRDGNYIERLIEDLVPAERQALVELNSAK